MTDLTLCFEVEHVGQPIRVRERHGTQQHRVEDAEDGGRDADPERKRDDGESDGPFGPSNPRTARRKSCPNRDMRSPPRGWLPV
jgi:hypothetical protein